MPDITICDIHNKHGDNVFCSAVFSLISIGQNTFRKMNVEKEIRIADILSTPSSRVEDERRTAVYRCAAELARFPVEKIVLYLQENVVFKDIRRFTVAKKTDSAECIVIICSAYKMPEIPEGYEMYSTFTGHYQESSWKGGGKNVIYQ